MTLNIRSPEADRLARRLAAIDGSSLTDAVVAALRETLRSRQTGQTKDLARSLRERHGIVLSEQARRPVSPEIWDELHDDPTRSD